MFDLSFASFDDLSCMQLRANNIFPERTTACAINQLKSIRSEYNSSDDNRSQFICHNLDKINYIWSVIDAKLFCASIYESRAQLWHLLSSSVTFDVSKFSQTITQTLIVKSNKTTKCGLTNR